MHYPILDRTELYTTKLDSEIQKNSWLIVTHFMRIPPHIGLLINGNYNSLNIQGIEKNIKLFTLQKSIAIKKIDTLYIKLPKHPVFSELYQLELFQTILQNYQSVSVHNTCLKPIKEFLTEVYGINTIQQNHLFYQVLHELHQNHFIQKIIANVSPSSKQVTHFELPHYTINELHEVILKNKL